MPIGETPYYKAATHRDRKEPVSAVPDWFKAPEGDDAMSAQLPLPEPGFMGTETAGYFQPGSQEHREFAVAHLLMSLGVDLDDPNFKETPRRVAAYFTEHFRTEEEVGTELQELKRAIFPAQYKEMVTEKNIQAHGICPHHLLPVEYTIHVGYLPNRHVVGLSKLARVPMLLTGLPLLQEELTYRIAQTLKELLDTEHVAVLVTGVHMCMVVRGVEQHASETVTSTMLGRYLENYRDCKMEFLAEVRR